MAHEAAVDAAPSERDSRAPVADSAEIEADLRQDLAERLLRDAPHSIILNLGLAAVLCAAVVRQIAIADMAAWWGLLGLHGALWLRYTSSPYVRANPDAVLGGARVATAIVGLIWGVGLAIASQYLPGEYTFLILVVLAGLATGAAVTLFVDSLAYRLFVAAMLLPPIGGLTVGSSDRLDHTAAAVMAALTLGLIAFQRRTLALVCEEIRGRRRLARSEAEATRQRIFLDGLLESAPVAVIVIDDANRVVRVNPAFERLFGYDLSTVIGCDVDALLVPPEEAAAASELTATVAEGRVVRTDGVRRTWDGQLLTVRMHAAPVHGVGDHNTLVMYEDVTALRAAERAVREAEEHYRGLVQSASDLVWQVDRRLEWTFVNRASAEIYGLDPDALVGRPMAERVDPDRWDADRAVLESILRSGSDIVDHETVHRHASGEPRYLSFSASPVREADGRVRGLQGIARNVTHQVRARHALEQAQRTAEEAGEARLRFLANMSHEIRTPLNGIIGMTEILLDSDLAPSHRSSVEVVKGSADALFRIVNDVLDFSKIETGKVELETIRFHLQGLVAATVKSHAVSAKPDVTVECLIDPAVPESVQGDPGRYRQILSNLLGNAVKFTEQGTIRVEVTLEESADREVRIRTLVRDTGIGIATEALDQVFEEFAQADPSTTRRYGGTGLGLAIAKRLVERMGGALDASSEAGVGSSFTFTVCLAPDDTPQGLQPGGQSLDGARVLLVVDNKARRGAIQTMLGSVGIVVDEAVDAEAAFRAVLRAVQSGRSYDIAVVAGPADDAGAFLLAERLRAEPSFGGETPIVVVTTGRPGDGARCRELGIAAYLTEPISRLELVEALVAVQAGRGAKRDDLITRHSIKETREELHVLVAEDNPVNLRVATTMLRRRGHRVDVATDGEAAVEAVRTTRFDVVLMDVQMPSIDGYEATRRIRALPERSDVPIVAVTAHAFEDERERTRAAGMDGFLSKPYKAHELFSAVERWTVTPGLGQAADVPSGGGPDALVDFTDLYRMMREGGAEEAVPEMIEVYLSDAADRMAELRDAVKSGEAGRIMRSAHGLKSASGSIRALPLMHRLAELEAAARDRTLADAAPAMRRIEELYGQVRTTLTEHLAERSAPA